METSAATVPAADIGSDTQRTAPAHTTALWVVGGLTLLGIAIRFSTLGLQSYHHDEVITAARVLPGSFIHMLREVKASESNPPLYYVLAWFWAKAFGLGEVGLRSLSALFGAATVPVAYFIGRELSNRRAGYITAAIVAVNPMLIWYSQEARSYALLVFFAALSMLFFLRAMRTRESRDLALWSIASIGALTSHYFAIFPIAIEGAWLLWALRESWRRVGLAIGGIGLVALGLVPLVSSQVNPRHIGWIDKSPLLERVGDTAVSFLIGETGHVIAEPPRTRYAIFPAILALVAIGLVMVRGRMRERRGAGVALVLGVGVVVLTMIAAFGGKDYVVERNLLPALVPIAAAVGVGFATDGAKRIGLLLATALCAYWLAFDIHVTQTPNLQRPDFRQLAHELGTPTGPRVTVLWKLAGDPLEFYLDDGAQPLYSGKTPVREINVIAKPRVATRPVHLPPAFHPVERIRAKRLTLTRYMARRPHPVPFYLLRRLPTGFGRNAVVIDGVPSQASLPGRVALRTGPLSFFRQKPVIRRQSLAEELRIR